MTTLNNRLKLALLNRRSSNNALEKGFTLVELMIVIVIVGISPPSLSELFEPNRKSKTTEASANYPRYSKSHAEYQLFRVINGYKTLNRSYAKRKHLHFLLTEATTDTEVQLRMP